MYPVYLSEKSLFSKIITDDVHAFFPSWHMFQNFRRGNRLESCIRQLFTNRNFHFLFVVALTPAPQTMWWIVRAIHLSCPTCVVWSCTVMPKKRAVRNTSGNLPLTADGKFHERIFLCPKKKANNFTLI